MIQLALATVLFMGTTNEPTVYVNGQYVSTEEAPAPIIRDNRVQVPLRAIFSALGANVEYLEPTRQVVISKGGSEVTMFLRDNFAYINGQQRYLDYPPAIVDGYVMVPLRFVTQALGANVRWDALQRRVIINTSVAAEKDSE